MSLFQRNLAKCGKTITLQNRSIQAPVSGTSDFTELFDSNVNTLALIKTVSGKTFFDGVATERLITHKIKIPFISGVTAETWIEYNSRKIDILQVENCCENDEVLILTCSDRGSGVSSRL